MNKESAVQQKVQVRPPVVVVLGHVDHGKSSLLEAIREDFKITSKESGGITQHMGAYVVEYQGKSITFLDTPGHEAFSAMRARGANVADIAVLVVAADEGVKLQTKEAIEQAKKAGLPLIVALNKIDKLEANPERVKQELGQEEIFVESFGGKVPCIETSATTKKGISELLEMILLMADLEHKNIDPDKAGEGVVIESSMDSRRGPLATLLVQNGSVRAGDVIATKSAVGKVRTLQDFQGASVSSGLPAMPVLIVGFEACPQVGETFQVFESEEVARAQLVVSPLGRPVQAIAIPQGAKTLDLVLKVDMAGSLEVLSHALLSLPQENVFVRLVDAGVGVIGDKDVRLAQGTHARIIGFRTQVDPTAGDLAQREGIVIETFDVIYDLIQRVRTWMEQEIVQELVTVEIGALSVLAVFLTEKNRQIIGGKVTDGEVRKKSQMKIFRGEAELGTGKIINLQKDKKDTEVAVRGEECGILYEGSVKIQQGDILKFSIQELQNKVL
ncbi:MAG: GTP-binding protein [bacterium]|nr:GTP-binding protein [bacterium]